MGQKSTKIRTENSCFGQFWDFVRIACVQLLCFLPTVVLGQDRVPSVQVSESPLSNSSIEILEEGQQDFESFRIVFSDEANAPSQEFKTWDMGGVDLFRLPEPPLNNPDVFVSDALIGPVWDPGSGNLAQDQTTAEQRGVQESQSQNSVTILEGNSKQIEIPLTLTSQPSADVIVTITGYNGTDLSVSPGQLTFTAQNWDTHQKVTLTANQDEDATLDPVIQLIFAGPGGGAMNSWGLTVTILDDEIPWTFSPRHVQEGSNTALPVFLLPELAPPSEEVTFTISGHEGTNLVLVPRQQELTFPVSAWQQTQTLNILAELDPDDLDEQVTLTLTASGGGYSGLKYIAEITIVDRPPFNEYIPEGERIVSDKYFIFSERNNPSVDITVTWSGFQETDLTVDQAVHMVKSDQWMPCLTDDGYGYCTPKFKTVISAADDPDDVDDQVDLLLTITEAPRERQNLLGVKGRIVVTIGDNDDPGIVVVPSTLSINENDSETFEVSLSEPPLGNLGNNDVTVSIPSRVGDLTSDKSSLTFTSGDWNAPQKVTLKAGFDDDLVNDSEAVILEASGGGYDLERARVSVTIIDDDEGALEVPDTVFVDEGSAEIFLVGLDHQPSDNVTVTISDFTPPNSNLTLNPKELKFAPADYLFLYRVGVDATKYQVTDDETYMITLTATGGGYDTQSDMTVIIKNKPDLPRKRLIVDPESITVGKGGEATFKVSLSEVPDRAELVTVTIPAFNNSDLTRTPEDLRFNFLNYGTRKTVTILADENATDGSETLTLTAKGGGYDNVTKDVTVKVEDTNLAGASLIVNPPSITVKEGGQEKFDISLSVQPSDSVTVEIPSFSNSNLTRAPDTLTFTTSNYDTAQPVTIRAADDPDTADEPPETLTLTASGGGFNNVTEQITVAVDDDDVASLRVQPKHISMIEGDSAKFEVSLSAQPSAEVTLTIPAFINSDLTRAPDILTFTTSNYDTAQPVTIRAEQDEDVKDESESITLTASGGGYATATEEVLVTVLDPSVRLLATPRTVSEGGIVEMTAEVSVAPKTDLLIPLIYEETGTDPATEFVDYDGPPSITISAGQPTGSEQISIRNDMTAEANETFRVKLGTLPSEVDPGNPSTQVITILNDDEPPPVQASLSVQPNPVNEGESVTVTATLARTLDETITIPVVCTALGTTDSDDYICPNSVTIPAEARSGNAVLGTRVDEDTYDEQVSVALGTHPRVEIGPPSSISLTILDTTPAVVTLSVSPREVEEGGEVTVTVTRSGASQIPVTIPVTCSSTETDEYDCPTQIQIASGAASGAAQISIEEDEVAESDEQFTVAIGSVLPPEMEAGDPSSQWVTILDNDQAGIRLSTSSLTIREGSSADYTIRLSSEPQAPVTLDLDEGSGQVTWSPPVLIFTSSNWESPQGVTVEAPSDDNTDSERLILMHTARSADPTYNDQNEDLPVHVIDRDTENLLIRPEELSVPEDNSREFTVALATEPSGFVTVQISPFSNLDLTRAPVALTFAPSNWDSEQLIRISAAADDDAESDAAEMLMLVANGGGYDEVSGMVRVTIQEKDRKGIQLNPTSLIVEEGGDSGTYTVALTSEPTSRVQIMFRGQGSKAVLNPASLEFTPSDWKIPKLVNVQAVEDSDVDDEMITLLHIASGGGYDQVDAELSLRIQDQGENLITISLYDAQAHEAEERVNLRAELNKPTTLPVSVRYRTIAGTAEAKSDYVYSQGIIFFDPGSKKGKLRIELVNDDIPESEEHFTVELSGAKNATIARPVGQVTILDDDASATMIRIDDAMTSRSDPRVQFTVRLSAPSAVPILVHYRTENGTANAGEDYHAQAGVLKFAPGELAHEIEVDLIYKSHNRMGKTFAVRLENTSAGRIENEIAMATIHEEDTPIALEVMEMYTTRFVRTSTTQIVEALRERHRSMISSCLAGRRADLVQVWGTASGWKPSLGELLAGCQVFQEQERERGWLSVWGRGTFTRFQGREVGALNLRGEVTTAMLGTDYRWQSGWLTGVLVAHSRGDGSFRVLNQSGPLQATLTGVIPYVSVQGVDWDAWMALGYGRGQTEVEALEGRLASVFGAAGVQGTWISNSAARLAVHGDVLVTGAEVEEHEIRGEVVRIRVGVEGAVHLHEKIRPYVEANIRQDGGDAETGIGLELGGGVRLASGRLKAEVRTHGLVMHTADGFTEWGTSGIFQIGGDPMGWTLSIRPSRGLSHGSSLHRQLTILDATHMQTNVHRTEMELAYGVPFRAGVARPVVGVTQLSTGRIYRWGTDLRPQDRMSFSFFGLIHSRRELGLNVRGTLIY